MDAPQGHHCHECCPKEWRNTPNFTGSHELDAVIHRNKNGNLPARMKLYADFRDHTAYGPLTAYSGYSNYHGDS